MAVAPSTQVLTAPNFQAVDAGAQLITVTGGTGTAVSLADILGNPIVHATYWFTGTPAATNQVFFMNTRTLPVRVAAMSCIFSVAAGGVSTLTISKDTGTQAPGTGTSIQTGSFNLNATANTVQNGVLASPPVTLAPGERLAVVFANAIQATVGLVVSVQIAAP
jgi:hypothetical protein